MHFTSLFAQAADTTYQYSSTTTGDTANTAGGVVVLLIALVVGLAMYALFAYLMGRIFKKAGVEAWKAWVPVYNSWVLLELGGQAGWWAIVSLLPFVGIVGAVFQYIAMYQIGLRLGKEGWFVLLAIFLPVVWIAWLALDQSTWQSDTASAAPTQAPDWTPPAVS